MYGEPERGDGDGFGGCGVLRGVGDFTSDSGNLLGDLGEFTVTTGGDLVGDLGGELRGDSWYMEIGRALFVSMDMPRVSGVRGGAYSPFGDALRRPTLGRGKSSDMRPSGRARVSSCPSKRLPKLCRGLLEGGGSGVEDDWRLSMFSKWLRSDDTGLMEEPSVSVLPGGLSMATWLGQQRNSVTGGLRRTHAPSLGDYNDR